MQGFTFQDGELIHDPFDCICGRHHSLPIRRIIVRPGALPEVAPTVVDLDLGKRLVMISDRNTFAAAGSAVEQELAARNLEVRHCHFDTDEMVKPDEKAVGSLMLAMNADTDLLVVVGSGSLTDLTRFVSARTGVPFVSVPTAPSMDGYAGNGAPMTQGGFKRTIMATHAQAVIADTTVMAAAPQPMIASGFSDTLAKLTSRIDWQLSQLVTGEYYCPVIVDGVSGMAGQCVDVAGGIATASPAAVQTLAEALVISGIGMVLVANSRPASGSEHSLSHYWEMKAQLERRPEYFHGTKVGVATAVLGAFYEEFFSRNPADVDLDALRQTRPSLQMVEKRIRSGLGDIAEGIISEVTRPQYREWPRAKDEIEKIESLWPRISQLGDLVPSCDRVIEIQKEAGAPWHPREIDVDSDYLRETLLNAKEVRSRYTVLRAAETLGWLEEITEAVVDRFAGM